MTGANPWISAAFTIKADYSDSVVGGSGSGSGNFLHPMSFDSQRASAIYGLSSTVQPLAIYALPLIKI